MRNSLEAGKLESMMKLGCAVSALLIYAVLGVLTFVCAGTTTLPFFWTALLIPCVGGIISLLFLSDEFLSERAKPKGEDQDKYGLAFIATTYVAMYCLPALDVGRWHVATFSNVPLQVAACLLFAVAQFLLTYSMTINSFFSSAVRLQTDRNQHVVDTGPYAIIRHPGYASGVLMFVSEALLLGSFLGFIPAILMIGSFVYRSLLEERILTSGLPGYPEYIQRVRYRLVPGIW